MKERGLSFNVQVKSCHRPWAPNTIPVILSRLLPQQQWWMISMRCSEMDHQCLADLWYVRDLRKILRTLKSWRNCIMVCHWRLQRHHPSHLDTPYLRLSEAVAVLPTCTFKINEAVLIGRKMKSQLPWLKQQLSPCHQTAAIWESSIWPLALSMVV